MESEDDTMDDVDSGNTSSGDDLKTNCLRIAHCAQESQKESEEYPYEVLSTEETFQHMLDCTKEVNAVVEIPMTITRILLNHFKWDKAKLLERLYDGDQDELFAEARVVNPFRAEPPSKAKRRRMSSPSAGECGICLSACPSQEMTGLQCAHRFCIWCWCEYLTTKIMEEGSGQMIACAAHDCDILVDDETVMRLVKDPRVKLKYQQLITNSFVECNRLLRWCPSPDCSNAVKVSFVDAAPVVCRCGHSFCFGCGESWHVPVKCHMILNWLKDLSSNWISVNTKECPKCKVTIEKNGGCNHMICSNRSCQADFCWACLELMGLKQHNCNSYDVVKDIKRKKVALQRDSFYCERYMNHRQSLRFEANLYASADEKMKELQEQHNMTWIEVQFLKKAVDVLCQCRQTLIYTYVFAYYLPKTNQSAIFEDNQRDLESATEKLSEYLERDITSENVADIKQRVQDKLRYCEIRRKVLLEHVDEGYEKDWWDPTE